MDFRFILRANTPHMLVVPIHGLHFSLCLRQIFRQQPVFAIPASRFGAAGYRLPYLDPVLKEAPNTAPPIAVRNMEK